MTPPSTASAAADDNKNDTVRTHYYLQLAGRLLLSVHFGSEAIDKVLHWNKWVNVIRDAGFPIPNIMLLLVVTLLLAGTPLLLIAGGGGGKLWTTRWAVGLLLLFQIPTTIFFETNSWYEQADSMSVMGGLLLALALGEQQLLEQRAIVRVDPTTPLSSLADPLLENTSTPLIEYGSNTRESDLGTEVFINLQHRSDESSPVALLRDESGNQDMNV